MSLIFLTFCRALKGSNENGNQLTADEQSAQSNNSSCFAGIDSAGKLKSIYFKLSFCFTRSSLLR